MVGENEESDLRFIELIEAIMLYPRSLFNYVSSNSYTKYYWVFIVVFSFFDTVKSIWEEYYIDADEFFILLMAIIPLRVLMVIAGQLLFLFLLFGLALAYGGKGDFFKFIKINSYSNLPLIIALCFSLLIYILDNSLHFINKPIFFTMLCADVICGIWAACLWVFSVSTTMKLTFIKSIVVSVLSIALVLFLYFLVFVPYVFNSVF